MLFWDRSLILSLCLLSLLPCFQMQVIDIQQLLNLNIGLEDTVQFYYLEASFPSNTPEDIR